MTVGAAGLLKLLAGVSGGRAGPAPRPAPAGPGFASLLDRAHAGTLSSGLPVTVSASAGVTLSDEQLARVADAADRAQAQGVSRALVLIDGRALTLDVALREVTGAADLSGGAVLTGMDGVVRVPGPAAPGAAAPGDAGPAEVLPLPRADAAGMNPSLLKLLRREAVPPASVR